MPLLKVKPRKGRGADKSLGRGGCPRGGGKQGRTLSWVPRLGPEPRVTQTMRETTEIIEIEAIRGCSCGVIEPASPSCPWKQSWVGVCGGSSG